MSFTRARYDPCAYDKSLSESTSVLTWRLDPNQYYNCNECRHEFGLVGGNNVSRYEGNMVDLESDLRGQTRAYSQCPTRKYQPGTVIQGSHHNGCRPGCSKTGLPCGSRKCRNDKLRHLRGCTMIDYKPRIDNVGFNLKYPPCGAGLSSQCGGGTAQATGACYPFRKTAPRMSRPYRANRWQGQTGISQPARY